MKKAKQFYLNLIKQSEMSTTMSVVGPSGSTKSTAQTMFLPPNSNRILAGNIGDAAQTSLIDTFIGLTSELEIDEVCIKCTEKKYGTDFQDSVLETIWTEMYEKRDELEEFEVTDDMVKSILNPANRSYHAYEFVVGNQIDVENLKAIVKDMVLNIASMPDELDDAVNAEFKERKKIDKKPVKKQVFQKIVMERFFSNTEELEKLELWYSGLISFIKEYFGKYWSLQDEFILIGNIQEDEEIEEFIRAVYDKNSAFSLGFSSLRYIVRPNDVFMEAYKQKYKVTVADKFKMSLNVLDTVGLTQTGDDKEIIDAAIEENLGKKVDAVLFLCAADSKPTVYQYCMESLAAHAKKIENVPFTLCRTKADTLLRNVMVNLCRKETGKNVLDKEDYVKYIDEALVTFKNDYLEKYEFGEDSWGANSDNDNDVIEYVSMAPDLYEAMLGANDSLNSLTHIIDIMLNLFYAADKKYIENDYMRIQSSVPGEMPIKIEMNDVYFNGLAANMVEENRKNKNQYMKYIKGCYHGYSITCFFSKHSRGIGHDTHCTVYDDFKLHIKNMIRGWLTRNMIDQGEKTCHFDYKNVLFVDNTEMIPFIKDFEDRFSEILHSDILNICDRVAKKLSYDCMEARFWECYNWKSRQVGFVENLELFEMLFDDVDYWNNNLEKAFYEEYVRILSRMCDFIVEEV